MVDIRGGLRLAGLTNPLLFGPAALATEVAYNMYPAEAKTRDNLERQIGSVLSYLNEQPYKIYAGEDYGPQSVGSYLKLRQSDPDRFPRPAGLKPPKAQTPATPAARPPSSPDWQTGGGAPGGSLPDTTTDWGTAQDVETGNFPADVKTPGKEPGFEELVKLLETQMSPEARREATNEAIRQFVTTSAISQALGAEKSRERYKREIELERIKSWTDMYKTAQQTNVLSQAMLGQALIASQQPSANVADILSKGTQSAQSVLGGFQLRT
jgi:hypothetical protein